MSDFLQQLLSRAHEPGLQEILTKKLSGTELNSLLIGVFNERLKGLSAPQLLQQYAQNRFVKPADLPVLEMRREEISILELCERHMFEPLELSPVSALGSCSAFGYVDQKKVLSSLRGTEVLADATNAIALYFAHQKKQKLWKPLSNDEQRKFSTIQRHIRTQGISAKGFTPHFKIGCLVSCGYDTGDYHFERSAFADHIGVMIELFSAYHADEISLRLIGRDGYDRGDDLISKVREYAVDLHDIGIEVMKDIPANGYYQGIQYKVDVRFGNKVYEIADGGFVNWTQLLLQNKKERMFTTGFGFELLFRILRGEI